MPETITSLIEKLEGAEVGSRELDCLLGVLLDGFVVKGELYGEPAFCRQDEDGAWVHPGNSGDQMVYRYTTSLDAALALAERVVGGKEALLLLTDLLTREADACDFDLITVSDIPRLLCAAVLRAQSEARV